MFSVSNEAALRKKLLEIHDYDCVTFDSESVLVLIERILNLVTFGSDDSTHTESTNHVYGITETNTIPDTLRSLLQKISCVFTCKCSGGDSDTSTMEILKLLSSYEWEAKFAIVLASFVVEYAQFIHVAKLYKNNPLGELLGILKQMTVDIDEQLHEIKSTFKTIVQVSIKVTRFISKFSCLPSKYISNEVETLHAASIQIPIAVYSMTRVVVACASKLTGILGQSEISPYTETWNLGSFEQNILAIHETFETHYELCYNYIEEKKQIKYIVKLKLKFDKTAVYANNQKILQLILNGKDGLLPLAFGPDKTKEVGVEALKGKTVLLLISDLDISYDEILILSKFYHESRKMQELQYEIVWLPIVEMVEEYNEEFKELKMKMPWHTLQHPRLLKPGFVRFVREEWHYSKKAILVALDPRGKVANLNAFHMVSTWGNTAYPFTQTRELDIWSRKEWSLNLLVDGFDRNITKWIKEDKIICLYGGEDCDWIRDFVTQARKLEDYTGNKIEMVYIGMNSSEELNGILTGRSLSWEPDSTRYFWKRIESMVHSESHQGAKVAMAKESIVVEVRNLHRVGQSDQGWALISHGAGSGAGKIAWGKGDVILQALVEFEHWSDQVKYKGFVMALNGYLAGIQPIPEMHVCTECHRPI
ncbi:hypothetical protein C2S53_010528 [Perilla frutescens var. hirtella]|uniref:Protein SIEVE ELEMENT OCCLUSION B-like n=1 Tax=Perilla frutescens var. hirtella TaxID=608512 RepID=A0AAD4INA9_PERFH|nr:hypothetical protein C2S53_010528 [Perilla frutescens var. hirtella]